MSNSNLVNYIKISPNSSNPRNSKIDKITIHHMSGNLSVETCGNVFADANRQASSNYGIGTDGRVGLYVDESNRAWTSANSSNDHRAITIEVANDEIGGNWHVSDVALAKLIDLCVDICKRNGIPRLNFTGDASGNLTMHKWFANTDCPGPYLGSKFPYIAEEVNKRLGATTNNPQPPVTPSQPQAPSNCEEYETKRWNETGIATFTKEVGVYNNFLDDFNNKVATYSVGEYANYDLVIETNQFRYISYVSRSGARRYVPIYKKETREYRATFK